MAVLTAEQIDDLTERWHAGEGADQSLREFLPLRIRYRSKDTAVEVVLERVGADD